MSPADWRRLAVLAETAMEFGKAGLISFDEFTRLLREEAEKQERAGERVMDLVMRETAKGEKP